MLVTFAPSFFKHDQPYPSRPGGSSTGSNPENIHEFTSTAKSILDAQFTSKKTRRLAFAILTKDSVTSLVRMDARRNALNVGEIKWEASGVREHAVTLCGKTMNSTDFLVRSKPLLRQV